MSAPFVTTLRSGAAEPIRVGSGEGGTLHLRVQVASIWDAVRVDVTPDATVRDVKIAVLDQLVPDSFPSDQYVVKLRGLEVLDENALVADAGARDGSILLILDRRRRPVR